MTLIANNNYYYNDLDASNLFNENNINDNDLINSLLKYNPLILIYVKIN